MRILSIHAHPDDAEILAGGSLALLSAAGHAVTIVTMTPGDCGSDRHPPEEISTIRRAESKTAAALIGASYQCAEFRDMAIFNDDLSRRRVCELIRQLRPEIVLTASPADYHPDHEATSTLVRDACFAASCPNYITGAKPVADSLPGIPHLYFMDAVDSKDREGRTQRADFFVDIAPYFAVKRDMLACHASQREWLRRQHHIDEYLLQMENWTKAIGARCGLVYAEGFRRYPGHPYPQSPVLEELFGTSLTLPKR